MGTGDPNYYNAKENHVALHDYGELPPGFRFHPTDEELVTFYLANKIRNPNFCTRIIGEADLNKLEPWELPARAKMGEKEWYFYSSRDRKYPTGVRTNRATQAGYWKATGKDREVMSSKQGCENVLVGMKKTLVFYRGRAPKGLKTNWVMHEYRVAQAVKDLWVLCRLFHKNSAGKKMALAELEACHRADVAMYVAKKSALGNLPRANIQEASELHVPTINTQINGGALVRHHISTSNQGTAVGAVSRHQYVIKTEPMTLYDVDAMSSGSSAGLLPAAGMGVPGYTQNNMDFSCTTSNMLSTQYSSALGGAELDATSSCTCNIFGACLPDNPVTGQPSPGVESVVTAANEYMTSPAPPPADIPATHPLQLPRFLSDLESLLMFV